MHDIGLGLGTELFALAALLVYFSRRGWLRPVHPPPFEPAEDLRRHVATLGPIHDRPGSEPEQLAQLARREEALAHSTGPG